MAMMNDEAIDVGTGDVFKDLGFADAQERRLRTELAMRLNDLIKERKLTQTAAAEIFGIAQSHVSELRNFKLRRFSSERLLHFITLLDKDVEIIIRPKARDHAAGSVSILVAT
ncbi:helix-turn-helix domain-containing protein [Thauera propionica]|uniref:helix-turn-helix domain-containing protein n=1 Tax=Thauera propionica TaxID=2019431 RepID=UPI0023F552DE|nr:helix-turn-helix transcriptional regulator [Thauera propionica]